MKVITIKNKKEKDKFYEALANNSPNSEQFGQATQQQIKKDLNKEYPKLLKAIDSKKLTQEQKRKITLEFTELLQELADTFDD